MNLVPARSPKVGDPAWWQETFYLEGYPRTSWKYGTVEIRRGKVCVVRNCFGHERVVGVGALFVRDT